MLPPCRVICVTNVIHIHISLSLSLSLSEIYIYPTTGRWIPFSPMKPNKTDIFRLYIMKTHIPPHAEETLSLSLSEIYIPNHR